MSSIEDRVWSDLVSDHAAKLAEATWPTATPHRRRPVLLVGSAVVVAGVGAALVLIPTGTTSPPAYAGPARRVPASSLANTLNMNAVVAEATIGNATFVVAPAVKPPGIMGRFFVPDELCFAVSGRLSGSGGASGMLTCGSRTSVETKGSGAAVTDGATGITTVWGFAPQGTTTATAGGKPVRLFGRFYETSLPPGVHNVVFTTPTGQQMTGDLGARSR